jgi:hypothetical protein
MKGEKHPSIENQDGQARELPIEAFARLVEGLDADDVENACAQDGAPAEGLPPAWSDRQALARYFKARCADSALDGIASGLKTLASAGALFDEFVAMPDGRLFRRAHGPHQAGAEGAMELALSTELPKEGDLVAVDIPGVGRLLRELRFVGAAALLCAPHGAELAIPVDPEHMPLLRVVKRADTNQSN